MPDATPDAFLGDVDAEEIPWSRTAGYPGGLQPDRVLIGTGTDGVEIAIAIADGKPRIAEVRRLWGLRWQRRAAPVVLVVAYQVRDHWLATVTGTKDDPIVLADLDLGQAERLCAAVIGAPDPVNADRTFHRLATGMRDHLTAGLLNSGLFAAYELRTGVPARSDWALSNGEGRMLLRSRGMSLLQALGFTLQPQGSIAHILSSGDSRRAIAVLLDADETYDRPSNRMSASSPVSHGLAVAQNNNLPWLIAVRGTQIRLYSAALNVGVGRKGPAETFVELDLALLGPDDAAYLPLLFSAAALDEGGSVQEILAASAEHAAALGERLRARVYEDVVPNLAQAVARHSGATTEDELAAAYHRTLIVLFRLLFVAYAEDRGLLPYQQNPRYTRKALKTLAKDFVDTPNTSFDNQATDQWDDLVSIWRAVDEGNTDWDVPAYNGGLFASDNDHPSGRDIASMRLTNAEIGPALRALLVDRGPDGSVGPVDFRTLTVRNFGDLYEGLLESSLSVAPTDLSIQPTGAYYPTRPGAVVAVPAGNVYFHNASGVRKSTGSYFTKALAVDHLLDTTLEPALGVHLEKVAAAPPPGTTPARRSSSLTSGSLTCRWGPGTSWSPRSTGSPPGSRRSWSSTRFPRWRQSWLR